MDKVRYLSQKNVLFILLNYPGIKTTPDSIINISSLDVEEQIINLRNTHVIINADVASLYGVEKP